MPVGAAIGSAVIGVGGQIIGANNTKKATQKASDTSLQVASQNNALAKYIYDQNRGVLQPYVNSGYQANGAMMDLLGFGATGGAAQAPAGALAWAPNQNASPMAQNGFYSGDYVGERFPAQPQVSDGAAWMNGQPSQIAGAGGYNGPMGGFVPATAPQPQASGPAPAAGGAPQGGAQSAYQRFLDSTGYQFRFGEGARALNTSAAANGLADSGAAAKALVRYGQDFGSNEFGRYMGYLANQQGVGLSAGSALAGVGQNYAGMVTANNNSAGEVAANAALMRGAANASMWNGIGSGIGQLAGTAYGSGWWK